MAKDNDKTIILDEKDKKATKLQDKKEKAIAKKAELAEQIEELRKNIADETDEKQKKKLRKERDELIAQRDGITSSKDGMTIPMAPKKKKLVTACIAIIVVIALLATYVCTGVVRNGLLGHFGVPQSAITGMTITDKDGEKHDIKVATYNYYFATVYNNLRQQKQTYEQYGINLEEAHLNVDFDKEFSKQNTTNDDGEIVTWAQYMEDEVIESILSTYTYYFEAVKANDGKEPEITEDQQNELDETLENYKDTAAGYGYNLSGYLTAAMGRGVTESVFRTEAKIAYIAENYKKELNDTLLEKEYSKEDYDNYKKENYDDLATVDVKIFECKNEDTAKKFKKELNADGSNFAELASKYSDDDWDKEAYKNPVESTYKNVTRDVLKSIRFAVATADDTNAEEKTYSGLDWLYSKDRKAGESKVFSTSVVYVVKPVNISEVKPVTVRHILITPYFDADETEDEDADSDAKKATAKQWAAAEKEAKRILAEYKKGDKTADSFAELAKKYSEDSNADDGGIYEDVTPNKMVSTFNEWIFNANRKAGDVGIVKTEYGYHIMYFESTGDTSVWKSVAQNALASEEGSTDAENLEKSYTIEKNPIGKFFFQKDTDIDS